MNISIDKLKNDLKAMAILDIMMTSKEDDWLRLVHFYKTKMDYGFILDNGSGDKLTITFTENGALIIGFDHENELNQLATEECDEEFIEYIYSNMPAELIRLVSKEEKYETTFCMWCTDGVSWMQNEKEDNDGGKEYLLGYICHDAKEWCEWAEDYYEMDMECEVVQKVFQGEKLTVEDIVKLNPECEDVEASLNEIEKMLSLIK